MKDSSEILALNAFRRAAQRVPAYGQLLQEAGVAAESIATMEDFSRLPLLDKHNTFSRFPIHELCLDGQLGNLGSVLTSSGHSGVFAFGLNEASTLPAAVEWTDNILDALFSVRSRKSLLINCLPMGVKVNTRVCTLAETSVRPDMAIALIKAFRDDFDQFVLIGDPGFIKHLLERGQDAGIDWPSLMVNVILGEETLPENARIYFEHILGIDLLRPEETGLVVSSMGIGELGLNLFFEAPPVAPLIRLRRLLHQDADLRQAALGSRGCVPSLFTYDPARIFVEFDETGRLILTTLHEHLRLPLIRYMPGDYGACLHLSSALKPAIQAAGLSWSALVNLPIVRIEGRSRHAPESEATVSPEAVKEGVYFDHQLARLTTANFRIVKLEDKVLIRIQRSPGVGPSLDLTARFNAALSFYLPPGFETVCEAYEDFGSGMALDYERKFDYWGP